MGSGPLWWQPYAAAAQPDSAAVALDRSVDVAIVGGGYTGLWTAYYLLRERPDLSVLVLEAEHVGFGASGRNGGWVSALFPLGADSLAAKHGREATARFLAELRHTVDEVGDMVAAEGIAEAGFVKGGVLSLARGPAHVARAQTEVEAGEVWGEGTVWLSAAQTRERMVASDVDGATWNPHCARVQPRALVRGAGVGRACPGWSDRRGLSRSRCPVGLGRTCRRTRCPRAARHPGDRGLHSRAAAAAAAHRAGVFAHGRHRAVVGIPLGHNRIRSA